MFFVCALKLPLTDTGGFSSYHLIKEKSLSQTTGLPTPYPFLTGILPPLRLYPLTFSLHAGAAEQNAIASAWG